MKNNFLIECNDFTTLQLEVNRIIKEKLFCGASINYYDMQEVPLQDALEDLITYGFFSDKKVIVITNFESVDLNDSKNLENLVKYVKNDCLDNILIISTKKFVVKENKYLKELKKNLESVEIVFDSLNYIQEQLKGYKIEKEVMKLLDNYCLGDITKIYNECNKLKAYKYENKVITKEDIEELVVRKLGDATDLTFSFTRALGEKNKNEALRLFEKILNYNVEPLSLIGLLASQFRIMIQVKLLSKKNFSNDEIAKMLNVKEFRVKKTKELIRYYSEQEILNLIIKLNKIDMQIKTSGVDPNLLIQLFIINV